MTARRRPTWDPHPPLWVTQPDLRPLAQQLAQTARRDLRSIEQSDPVGAVINRGRLEDQIRTVLAAGWQPPTTHAQVGSVDELEALPPGAVVTDPDGQVWVRNRVGEWCEPYPAGIDPADLLADGPVTVHRTPADHDPVASPTIAAAAEGRSR